MSRVYSYCSNSRALHIASRRGQAAALVLLLDEGADINAKDDEGTTPLLAAIIWQCDEVLDILLERGAKVNPEALHTATAGACVSIMLRLLKGVAEINTKDEKERTLLHTAASVKRWSCCWKTGPMFTQRI
jgi:ankyrin repeat protein